jgi:alpha/beta superfamily hydrolase
MRGTEKIFIRNNDIRLEAEFFLGSKENLPTATLVCHPHPQFLGI